MDAGEQEIMMQGTEALAVRGTIQIALVGLSNAIVLPVGHSSVFLSSAPRTTMASVPDGRTSR